MQRRSGYNQKRRICKVLEGVDLKGLVASVNYGGNPEHKRNPGDFGLTPPAQPRPDKSLCDTASIFSKREAIKLLRSGVERGLISTQTQNGYPQNIWAVTEEGIPLEAQLENSEQGTYHGYPVPEADPFSEKILAFWNSK